MQRRLLALLGAAVLLGACSSSNSTSSPGTTARATTPGTDVSAGTGTGSRALDGVTVPDAWTPVVVTPIASGTFPWAGTDGKYHLDYDLQLTNASRLDATLEKVEVVDAHDPERVIASFSGTQLVDPTCLPGDCNRLRELPSTPAKDTAIPSQASRALFIDLTFDTKAEAPPAVLHRFFLQGQAGPADKQPSSLTYLAAPYDTSAGTPRVIGPPLRGTNWIALNSCCDIGWPHRQSLLPLDGKLNNSQRFAIDWKRVNDAGEFYTGDKTKNESYVDYGADLLAVADATVVATLDDVEANAPGVLPVTDPELAKKLTLENVDGNHVVLDLGGGVYAMYAHMIKGTLTVKVGDKVTRGQVIGKLGNTGNANASHLHFQLQDGPSLLHANGLPYAIDSFTYRGQVDPELLVNADDYVSGKYLPAQLPAPQARTDQMPMVLAIIDFPG